MSTVMPQSELTRKAVAWLSEQKTEKPDTPLSTLIEQAAMRFNLGPKDVQFLERFSQENKG